MPSENDKRRVRQAVEQSIPPARTELRRRALWAVMAAMRRRSSLGLGIVVAVALLLLAAAVYAAVRCL